MRSRTALPSLFCLASASVLLPLSPAAAHAATAAGCAPSADGRSFPLETRIHGGPNSYAAGGDYGIWYIDLTNTAKDTCTGVHPVVVLVDERRALKPAQPRMDFYDGSKAHPVRFVTTDEQELIGVLEGDGFGGFTVAPGKTVRVKVRLALTPDATPEQVTANAAVIQRKGDDGDWVGESNAYRFGITDVEDEEDEEGDGDELPTEAPTGTAGPREESPGTSEDSPGTGETAPGNPESAPATGNSESAPATGAPQTAPPTGTPRATPTATSGSSAPADTRATPGTPATPTPSGQSGSHPATTPAPTLTGAESPGPTFYPATPKPTPTPGTAAPEAPAIPSTSDDVAEPPEDPEGDDTTDPEDADDPTDSTDPSDHTDPTAPADQLAETGPAPARPLLAATTALLALGAAAFLIARRRPRIHPRDRH
ncbi:hypothetical protein [Streptomyces sp. NPDC005435]|uniref:hypothetical protein n=1 Tax=Streptomyces sp. NPDC005435 TaxID=3154464 RepID=UPI003454C905